MPRRVLVAAFLAGELGFGGDEFAAERLGEDGLGEVVGTRSCQFQSILDSIREFQN